MKYVMLALPGLITLAVPFYNRASPTLAGFPFYFWFLLALVPLTTLCIYSVYKMEAR